MPNDAGQHQSAKAIDVVEGSASGLAAILWAACYSATSLARAARRVRQRPRSGQKRTTTALPVRSPIAVRCLPERRPARQGSDGAVRNLRAVPRKLSNSISTMTFFRARGHSFTLVVVMCFVALLQGGISYTIGEGELRKLMPDIVPAFTLGLTALRIGLVLLIGLLWALNRKRALFQAVIAANAFFTLTLLTQTYSVVSILAGISSHSVRALLIDTMLMAISNIVIFSVWYWIIDPPGVEENAHEQTPWAFLFPQRASPLPHYGSWSPRYADYLFVAFTTSFAFSPTDTLPLTLAAKMLMLLQSGISLVIITGIAGSAINVLAGGSA